MEYVYVYSILINYHIEIINLRNSVISLYLNYLSLKK